MRLALGTVQFGLDYGATNDAGQTDMREVERILDLAAARGVEMLDTAAAYGESETVLGQVCAADRFRIITKLPPDTRPDQLHDTVKASCDNLRIDHLDGLMCHRVEDYMLFSAQDWLNIKKDSDVSRIGVSAYTADDIERVLNHHIPDIIQVPINVFDQRLIGNGALRNLKERGVEVYARSLFLQGILLYKNNHLSGYFDKFNEEFSRYHAFLNVHKLTPLEGTLAFAHSVGDIDYGVFGVNNAAQLEQTLDSFEKVREIDFINALDFSTLASEKQELVDPQTWQL